MTATASVAAPHPMPMISDARPPRPAPLRLLALALALYLAPALAQAAPTPFEPLKGYGPVAFGTRWEQAQKLLPQAEVLPDGKNLGAASVGGPFVHRLFLKGQQLEGFEKPVNVELRFWKKKLWVVQVYTEENSDQDVVAALTKRLGANQGTSPDNLLWITDTVQVSGSVKQHTFGAADLGLSAEAQAWFKKLMRGEWKQPSQVELDEVEGRTPAAK